jgi:putative transposase
MGCLLVVVVHAANIYDGRAARFVVPALFLLRDTVKNIWADGAYSSAELIAWVKAQFDCVLEVVEKKKPVKGFQVVPRRWVVERTFSWFGRNRRLAKDWENLATTLQTFVVLASIQIAIRRLAR